MSLRTIFILVSQTRTKFMPFTLIVIVGQENDLMD